MTKSFLVYPTGAAGVALLLQRLMIATTLALTVTHLWQDWIVFATLLVALCLVFGVGTRAAAVVSGGILFFAASNIDGMNGNLAAVHGVSAITLSMLGAGAYSVDGHWFGRHVIRLDL